jgi:hypothetical protein
VKVAEEDNSDDFSTEAPSVDRAGAAQAEVRRGGVERPHPQLSARFQNYPSVLTSHVSVLCQTDTRYLVNTEGSRIEHGRGFARVVITLRPGPPTAPT